MTDPTRKDAGLKVGDKVLIHGIVRSVDPDGLIGIEIRDKDRPIIVDVRLWGRDLISNKEGQYD